MSLTETQLAAWVGSSTSTRTHTVTSGSFTPTANSLVVVVTGCGNAGGVTVTGITVSDSVSGTWTKLVQLTAGGQFADASVWVKDAGASPSSQTVTVSMSPTTVLDVGLTVRQFTGAAAAASQTGVTHTASGTIATVSITPGTTGSQVVGAWGNAASANVTANGSTTFYGQTSDSGGAQEGAFEATSLSTSGTPITLGYTASQAGSGFAVAEILPASGTTHSGTATLSGSGSLTASGLLVLPGAATLSGSGTLTATGHTTRNRTATLSGTGSLTAAGAKLIPGASSLSGAGALTASGFKLIPGAASLSGTGSLTATGHKLIPAAAALSGAGTLTGAGHKTVPGAAALAGTGSLSAAGSAMLPAAGGAFNAVPGTAAPGLADPGVPGFFPQTHAGALHILMRPAPKQVTGALALRLPGPSARLTGIAGSIGPLRIGLPVIRAGFAPGKAVHQPLHIALARPVPGLAGTVSAHPATVTGALHVTAPVIRFTMGTGKELDQPVHLRVPAIRTGLTGKVLHQPLAVRVPAVRLTLATGRELHQPLHVAVPPVRLSVATGKVTHTGTLALNLS